MNPLQSLHVDNEPRMLSRFAVPEMSLSSARSTMVRHSFAVTIKTVDLIHYLEPAYSTLIEELKADDALLGGPQDELAEAGYPNLEQLVKAPKLLELVVGHYLLQDLLCRLTWDGVSPIEYWLDEVSECRSDERVVHISGICFSKQAR